ncbi:MAG: ARPP-1 family domain-containing protein [Blastocatellia bacterium]
MKRRIFIIGLFLIAICFGIIGAMSAPAQRKAISQPQNPPAADYAVSGPYTHKNLTIFLLHGAGQSQGRAPLTLQEAMKRKLVVVRETGDVNRLTIQNRSNQEVFVQAGDIVKGGQQDRVLALDLIVPPKSRRIPIESFCVEQGRWNRRGDEAVTAFSASDNALASKGLKIAAKAKGSQGEVWANVSKAQEKLAMNLSATPSVTPAPGRARRGVGRETYNNLAQPNAGSPPQIALSPVPVLADRTEAVTLYTPAAGLTLAEQLGLASRVSPSSLQLTLENKLVKDTANDYVKNLSSIISGKRDVIGFVFAINGQLNSADVYSSNALFAKLWPKMLEASAVEAIAELKAGGKFEPVETDAVKAFLRESQSGKAETKRVTARTAVIKCETEKNLFFETRDRGRGDGWVHRNYLLK